MKDKRINASKLAAKDTLLYFPMKILVGLIGFITLRQYLILFEKVEYGRYSVVNSTISWTTLLFGGWIAQSALRYYDVYKNKQKEKEFYSSLFLGWFIVNLIGIILGLGIYFGLKDFLNERVLFLTKYAIFVFVSVNTIGIVNSLLRASRNTLIYSLISVFLPLGKLALFSLLSLKYKFGIESILIASFVIDFVIIVFLLFKFKHILSYISLRHVKLNTIETFIRYGFPLLGLALTSAVLSFADRYIITLYRGAEETGIYAAGYNIVAAAFEVFLQAFMIGLYPIIIQTWNKMGKSATEELIQKAFRWYMIIMVPAGMGMSAISKILMELFSPQYVEARKIIPWVALGMVILGITQYTNKIWELMEKPSMILKLNLVAAVSNIVLNLICIPHFGFVAAAITTMASYLIYLILSIIYSRKLFQWSIPFYSIFKILLAGMAMSISILWISARVSTSIFSLLILIIIGAIVYFVFLFASGETKEELAYIKKKITILRKG